MSSVLTLRLKPMKTKSEAKGAVQDLCKKLKLQLDELSTIPDVKPKEDEIRLAKLMEQLKQQLADLST